MRPRNSLGKTSLKSLEGIAQPQDVPVAFDGFVGDDPSTRFNISDHVRNVVLGRSCADYFHDANARANWISCC